VINDATFAIHQRTYLVPGHTLTNHGQVTIEAGKRFDVGWPGAGETKIQAPGTIDNAGEFVADPTAPSGSWARRPARTRSLRMAPRPARPTCAGRRRSRRW
jgi:hypothetical protein